MMYGNVRMKLRTRRRRRGCGKAKGQNKTPQTQFEFWDVCRSALPRVLLKNRIGPAAGEENSSCVPRLGTVGRGRLRLGVPSQPKKRLPTEGGYFFLRACGWGFLSDGTRLRLRPGKREFESTIELDGDRKVAGVFWLHAKNLSGSAEDDAWVGEMFHPNRHLHCGPLWNQEVTGQQNAPETDVLGSGAHFFVLVHANQDRQVQRVAKFSSLLSLGGVHRYLTRWREHTSMGSRVAGIEGAQGLTKKAGAKPVTCYSMGRYRCHPRQWPLRLWGSETVCPSDRLLKLCASSEACFS